MVQLFAGAGDTEKIGAGDGGPAAAAGFRQPIGLAHDKAGNVFIADRHGIRRVDATTGLISTVTGARIAGGPSTPDVFDPGQLAVDAAGNLFTRDLQGVVEFTPDGMVRTVAGRGATGPASHITGVGVAVDAAGDLHLSDYTVNAVYKLTRDGALTLVAGGHGRAHSGDGGPAVDASFVEPQEMAFGPDGALYVVDKDRVRRIDPDGTISTVAGGGTAGCDGVPATAAQLGLQVKITFDLQGRLILSELDLNKVVRLEADGTLRTLLGQGPSWVWPPSATLGAPGPLSTVAYPTAVDVLPDGRLLVGEQGAYRVVAVTAVTPGAPSGIASVLAGTGSPGQAGNAGDGGAACGARLAYPTSLARAGDGSTYVADYANSQIRRISQDGRITTVAGTGLPGFSGDGGPATTARLDRPRSVAVDPAGRVLIADVVNNRIRRLDPATGLITTIAGTGQWGNTGDGGPATTARLAGPHGVTVSPDGTVWVADTGNHTIRKISPDGTISTAAGTGASGGAGDGGPAAAAQLTSPRGVAADSTAVYLSDPGTRSVRRIDLSTGIISTLAGPVTGTPLTNPASMLPTPAGLLVADAGSNRILRLSPSGTGTGTGTAATVTVVAGTGSGSPGPATSPWAARRPGQLTLAQPQGLAAAADGTLLIADTGHHQVVQVTG